MQSYDESPETAVAQISGDFTKFGESYFAARAIRYLALFPEIAGFGTQISLHVAAEVRQRRKTEQVGDVGEREAANLCLKDKPCRDGRQ